MLEFCRDPLTYLVVAITAGLALALAIYFPATSVTVAVALGAGLLSLLVWPLIWKISGRGQQLSLAHAAEGLVQDLDEQAHRIEAVSKAFNSADGDDEAAVTQNLLAAFRQFAKVFSSKAKAGDAVALDGLGWAQDAYLAALADLERAAQAKTALFADARPAPSGDGEFDLLSIAPAENSAHNAAVLARRNKEIADLMAGVDKASKALSQSAQAGEKLDGQDLHRNAAMIELAQIAKLSQHAQMLE